MTAALNMFDDDDDDGCVIVDSPPDEADEDVYVKAEPVCGPLDNDMVYAVSPWTRLVFDDAMHAEYSAVNDAASLRSDPSWTTLLRELFARLYAIGVSAIPPEDVSRSYAWAQKVHDMVAELPEWKEAAAYADQNEDMAGVVASAVAQVVHKTLPPKELGDVEEEERVLEALRELGDPEEFPGLEESIKNQEAVIGERLEAAVEAKQAVENEAAKMRAAIRESLKDIVAEAQKVDACMVALYGASLTGPNRVERAQLSKLVASIAVEGPRSRRPHAHQRDQEAANEDDERV